MEKLKQYKYIILIVLIVLGLDFYWHQVRPTWIMHECSWVKEVNPATLDGGLYEQYLREKNVDLSYSHYLQERKPSSLRMNGSTSTPVQPEQVVSRHANKSEYDFCLHDNGLK